MERPKDQDGLSEPTESPSAAALAGMPVAGITRRRIAFVLAAVLVIWIVSVFARQVAAATEATSKVDQLRAANAALAAQVSAMEREKALVQLPVFIDQQARAYDLGKTNEHAFALDPNAPPVPANAPGSASQRLGTVHVTRTPLDSWLSLLFGSSGIGTSQ